MNLSLIIASQACLPMSPNPRDARVPSSVANVAGSIPGRRIALMNRRRTTASLPGELWYSERPFDRSSHFSLTPFGISKATTRASPSRCAKAGAPPFPPTIHLTSQSPEQSAGAVASTPYHQIWRPPYCKLSLATLFLSETEPYFFFMSEPPVRSPMFNPGHGHQL